MLAAMLERRRIATTGTGQQVEPWVEALRTLADRVVMVCCGQRSRGATVFKKNRVIDADTPWGQET
jgi:hypothetical protein